MSSSSVATRSVTPSFTLRGVHPSDIHGRYMAGEFQTYRPVATKIKIASGASMIAHKYSTDQFAGVYAYTDKSNIQQVIATSDSTTFDQFIESGGKLQKGGRCPHCLRDFEHQGVGIPLKMKVYNVYREGEDTVKVGTHYVFWVSGNFCTFSGALKFLRTCVKGTFNNDSEELLQLMWKIQHPTEELLAGHDFRLSPALHGPLSDEEFNDTKYRYVQTGHMVMIPAKLKFYKAQTGK